MSKQKIASVASDSLITDFKKLYSLKVDELNLFLESFKIKEEISFDDEIYESFLIKTNIDPSTVQSIYSVSNYLFESFIKHEYADDEISKELDKLVERAEIKKSAKKNEIIIKLLSHSENLKDKLRVREHITGILPFLQSTTGLFELRTIFDDDSNIKSYQPIGIIKIKAVTTDEKIKSIDFQTDLDSLKKLIGFFQEYQKKLEVLDEKAKILNNV